jgi:hypothetical protein
MPLEEHSDTATKLIARTVIPPKVALAPAFPHRLIGPLSGPYVTASANELTLRRNSLLSIDRMYGEGCTGGQCTLWCDRQEDPMGAVLQVQVSDDLKSIIDRQVAEGHAASDVDFVREATLRYAEHLDAEEEFSAIAEAGIAASEAGDYILIETNADAEALFERTMARVRDNLAADNT